VTARPKLPHAGAASEPEAFVQADTQTIVLMNGRGPCQTNDPMPIGRLDQPVPQMPTSPPLRVAPIPNACPVTRPWSHTTVFTTAPRAPRTVPAQGTTKPQP
jgi:hypothetical protein